MNSYNIFIFRQVVSCQRDKVVMFGGVDAHDVFPSGVLLKVLLGRSALMDPEFVNKHGCSVCK